MKGDILDPLFKLIETDYKNKVEVFKKEIHEPGSIVFLGDSMISYWNIGNNIKNDNIINWGIGGDTTIGVLDRLDLVINLNPSIVIISVGSNDLIRVPNTTINDIGERIKLINEKLKKSIPDVIVKFISLLPVLDNHEITNENYLRKRTNKQIDDINNAILKHIEYIDVNTKLKDKNNKLKLEYTMDGIHLNDAGYKIFSQAIANEVSEIILL